MDRVGSLLHRAAEVGLTVTVDRDRLIVRGPKSCEALANELLAHKTELLAVLRERTLSLGSGCELHGLNAESVEERWQQAETQIEAAPCCACCGGPCHDGEIACTRCEPLSSAEESDLERPPLCAYCGAPGYTFTAAHEWLCEPCLRRGAGTEEAGAA